MKRTYGFAVSLLLVGLAWGCGSAAKEDPILRLSSEEAFAKGEELMADGKYAQAREYFSHAFQTAPNSEIGRDALLQQADAYFLAGGEINLVKAEGKYRDFNNRYPTSEKAAYVQFQVANSLAKRMRKADRDQTETLKAMAAFEELLSLYPTSEYTEQAEAELRILRSNLARHEYLVAKYQLRRGLVQAAKDRLLGLVAEYPDYEERDLALFSLGIAHQRLEESEEARSVFDTLRSEFPSSEYVKKIPSEFRS